MKINLAESISRIFAMLDNLGAANAPSDLTDSKLEQNILMTISRHQNAMDWLVDQHSTGKVRPRTRKVLRWALAEIVYLSGVPAPHVVDAATAFVKRRHSQPEAGFVNACLRAICSELNNKDHFFDNAPEHIKYCLPQTIWQRWLNAFGEEQTKAIAQDLLHPSNICFRVRNWPVQPSPAIPPQLLPMDALEWAPQAKFYKLDRQTHVSLADILKSPTHFYIQDPATLLAPALLAPRPGEVVADLCAAPGGKSVLLAEAMQDVGVLYVNDINETKLDKLRENLKEFSLAVFSHEDASDYHPNTSLDAVLLDVPCSNTGVLRRKPDAKWSFDAKKLDELTQLQARILECASQALNPRGRLVYSTCSIEHEENDAQVQAFLDKHPDFKLVSQRQLLPAPDHDGAFAALLQKR